MLEQVTTINLILKDLGSASVIKCDALRLDEIFWNVVAFLAGEAAFTVRQY